MVVLLQWLILFWVVPKRELCGQKPSPTAVVIRIFILCPQFIAISSPQWLCTLFHIYIYIYLLWLVGYIYIYICYIYSYIYIYKIIFPMFSRSQSSKVPKFILFFALCWVLHTSWDRPRSSPDESSEGPGRSKWLQRLCDLIFKYILEPLGCRTRVLMNESGEAKQKFIIQYNNSLDLMILM